MLKYDEWHASLFSSQDPSKFLREIEEEENERLKVFLGSVLAESESNGRRRKVAALLRDIRTHKKRRNDLLSAKSFKNFKQLSKARKNNMEELVPYYKKKNSEVVDRNDNLEPISTTFQNSDFKVKDSVEFKIRDHINMDLIERS